MVIRAHECVMVGSSRSIDDMMVHSFAWIHLKEKVQHEPTLLRAHLLLLPYLHHLTTHFFPSFVQPFQDGFERFANGKLITVFSATERYKISEKSKHVIQCIPYDASYGTIL